MAVFGAEARPRPCRRAVDATGYIYTVGSTSTPSSRTAPVVASGMCPPPWKSPSSRDVAIRHPAVDGLGFFAMGANGYLGNVAGAWEVRPRQGDLDGTLDRGGRHGTSSTALPTVVAAFFTLSNDFPLRVVPPPAPPIRLPSRGRGVPRLGTVGFIDPGSWGSYTRDRGVQGFGIVGFSVSGSWGS